MLMLTDISPSVLEAILLLLSPSGCRAFTGGFVNMITAIPSESTRYSAVGAMPGPTRHCELAYERAEQLLISKDGYATLVSLFCPLHTCLTGAVCCCRWLKWMWDRVLTRRHNKRRRAPEPASADTIAAPQCGRLCVPLCGTAPWAGVPENVLSLTDQNLLRLRPPPLGTNDRCSFHYMAQQ